MHVLLVFLQQIMLLITLTLIVNVDKIVLKN